MKSPVFGGRITAPFDEPRPLEGPKTHIHGALDIAGGDGIIKSPCTGEAQGFVFFRQKDGTWKAQGEKPQITEWPWRNYWADIFGAIITIKEHGTGRLHILAHTWPAQLGKLLFTRLHYIESAETGRWPAHGIFTEKALVMRGKAIAMIGNSGYSTGPHLHWEIHHQADHLDDYAARVNPKEYVEE